MEKAIEIFVNNALLGPNSYTKNVPVIDPIKLLPNDKYCILQTKEYSSQEPKSKVVFNLQKLLRQIPSKEIRIQPANPHVQTFLDINHSNGSIFNPNLILNKNTSTVVKQQDCLKKHKFGVHPFNKALSNQYGIISTVHIAKNVVLGKYIGIQYTNKEFEHVYSRTWKHCQSQQYAFEVQFKVPKAYRTDVKQNKNYTHYPFESNAIQYLSNCSTSTATIVIDGYSLKHATHCGCQNLMIFVNDAKTDLLNDKYSTRQNAEFCVVDVNGWPEVFIITTKQIQPGEEILVDYGPNYHKVVKNVHTWKNEVSQAYDTLIPQLNQAGICVQQHKQWFLKKCSEYVILIILSCFLVIYI